MKKRELGKSGVAVSVLGMGCWAYGGGAYWGEQSQNDVNRVVCAALDRGVNFFDTAEMYNNGASEIALGKALAGRRGEAVLCSKLSPSNAAHIREHLEASLKRLGTDYLDVYMLHWPMNPLALRHFTQDRDRLEHPPAVEEVYRQMEALKQEGLIRCIGMSNFGARQMEELVSAGIRPDMNEMPYNIVSRAIEAEVVPFCVRHNIALVGSMALQQGLLAGLYGRPEDVPPPQAHSRHYKPSRGDKESRHTEAGAETEIFAVVERLKTLSARTGHSLAALSIAWILGKPFMASTLAGSRNAGELEANIAACSVELPADIIEEIDAVSLPVWRVLGDSPDYYENREKSRIF